MAEKTKPIILPTGEIYIPVEITKDKVVMNCQHLFDSGITGKFKIKLELDNNESR